jgi:hypothetical protein
MSYGLVQPHGETHDTSAQRGFSPLQVTSMGSPGCVQLRQGLHVDVVEVALQTDFALPLHARTLRQDDGDEEQHFLTTRNEPI